MRSAKSPVYMRVYTYDDEGGGFTTDDYGEVKYSETLIKMETTP